MNLIQHVNAGAKTRVALGVKDGRPTRSSAKVHRRCSESGVAHPHRRDAGARVDVQASGTKRREGGGNGGIQQRKAEKL